MSPRKLNRTRLALIALLLSIFATATRAQTRPSDARPGGGQIAGALLDRARDILRDLKPSDEQQKKIDSILDSAKADLQQMRPSLEGLEPRERIQKVRGFLDGVREKLAAELNDDQKAQFQKKIDEARQSFANRFQQGGGPGAMMERLRDSLAKLDLTDDQRARLKDLFDDVRTKGQQIREQFQDQNEQAREKFGELMQDTRQKLQTILTPEQTEKLKELMRGGPGPGGPRGGDEGKPRPAADRNSKSDDKEMKDSDMKESGKPKPQKSQASPPPQKRAAATGPAVGDPAPADLVLRKLDGSSVQLSSFKGQVVVLEFGSYTCPSFRQRAAGMEQLRRDLGARAQFFVVYTKEDDPAGATDFKRNSEDKISIAQHASMADRRAAATKARDALKISLPIFLDDMKDSAAAALGAGSNSMLVIARDGTIAARQQWADPYALRRHVEQALKELSHRD